MFNGNEGNLGQASGSIVINTESVEAAVKIAQEAASAISASMAQIDAAQNRVGVKNTRAQSADATADAIERAAQREIASLLKVQAAQDRHEIEMTRLATLQIDLEQKKISALETADAAYTKSEQIRTQAIAREQAAQQSAAQKELADQAKYSSMLDQRLEKEAAVAQTSMRLAQEAAAKKAEENAAIDAEYAKSEQLRLQTIAKQQEAEAAALQQEIERQARYVTLLDERMNAEAVAAERSMRLASEVAANRQAKEDIKAETLFDRTAVSTGTVAVTGGSAEEILNARLAREAQLYDGLTIASRTAANQQIQDNIAVKATVDALIASMDKQQGIKINGGFYPNQKGYRDSVAIGSWPIRTPPTNTETSQAQPQSEAVAAAQQMISALEAENVAVQTNAEVWAQALATKTTGSAAATAALEAIIAEARATSALSAALNEAATAELNKAEATTAAAAASAAAASASASQASSDMGGGVAPTNGSTGGMATGGPPLDESGQAATPDSGGGGSGAGRVPFGMRASRALIPFGFLANQLGAGDVAKIIFTAQASLSLVEFIPKLGDSFTQLASQLLAMNGPIGDAARYVANLVVAETASLTAEEAQLITKNALTAATLAGKTAEEAATAAQIALTEATAAAATGAEVSAAAIATVFLPIIAIIVALASVAKLLSDSYNEQKKAAEEAAAATLKQADNIRQAAQIANEGNPTQLRINASSAQANVEIETRIGQRLQSQLEYYQGATPEATAKRQQDIGASGMNAIQVMQNSQANIGALNDALEKNKTAVKEAEAEIIKYNLAQEESARIAKLNEAQQYAQFQQSLRTTSSSDVYQQLIDNETAITNAHNAGVNSSADYAIAVIKGAAATDDATKDQETANALSAQLFAEKQSQIVDETTKQNEWLKANLPLIEARQAEAVAIQATTDAIQNNLEAQKQLAALIAGGDTSAVRKQISDLRNQVTLETQFNLNPNQERVDEANRRLAAQSTATGTPLDQLQALDPEYIAAKGAADAAQKSITSLNGQIDLLATYGERGAAAISKLSAEQNKVAALRRYGSTSSNDLNTQYANDQEDAQVAFRAQIAAQDEYTEAIKRGDTATAGAAVSKYLDAQATMKAAMADQELLPQLIAIAKAREAETLSIEAQRDALQHAITYNAQLADAIRTATPEQAADKIYNNQEQMASLKDALPALAAFAEKTRDARDALLTMSKDNPMYGETQALAQAADQAAKDFASANTQLTNLSQETSDYFTKVIPAAIARATQTLIDDITKMRIDSQAKVDSINADEQAKEADALDKYNTDIKDAEKKNREQALKDQKDFNDKRAKIDEQYRIDFNEAVGNRDALAALKAQQKRDKDLGDLEKDYTDQKKELAKALKDQKEVAKQHYQDSLAQAKDAATKALAAEQLRLRNEIAARVEAYQKQLADLTALGVNSTRILANMAVQGIDALSVLGNSASTIFANMASIAQAAAEAARRATESANAAVTKVQAIPSYGGVPQTTYRPTPYPIHPQYATGTPYLTHDQMAELHSGEGVINEAANSVVRHYLGNNYSQSDIAHAVTKGFAGTQAANHYQFVMGDIAIHATDYAEIKHQASRLFDEKLDVALKSAGIKK